MAIPGPLTQVNQARGCPKLSRSGGSEELPLDKKPTRHIIQKIRDNKEINTNNYSDFLV